MVEEELQRAAEALRVATEAVDDADLRGRLDEQREHVREMAGDAGADPELLNRHLNELRQLRRELGDEATERVEAAVEALEAAREAVESA